MDARLIPCGDEPLRQLSFKKDVHVKVLVRCLTHTKYSNNCVFITCLSLPQNLSSSLCQPMACPTWPPVGAQQEEASLGTPKPTKVWEDHTPRTNTLILKLTTGMEAGSVQEGALSCTPLWGMGSSFLLVTVPSPDTGSLHPLTPTDWPLCPGSHRGVKAPWSSQWPGMPSMPGQNSSHQFSRIPAFHNSSSAVGCVCVEDPSPRTARWGDEW